MKLGLVQTKQNELYFFSDSEIRFTRSEALQYQSDMVEQTLQLVEDAMKQGCDVVVTPEAFNYPGQAWKLEGGQGEYASYIPALDDALFQRMADLAKQYQSYLIAGVCYRDEYGCYNAAITYDKSGHVMDRYHKVHLVGEEKETFVCGKQYSVLDTEYGKIGIAICYDMQFPESVREMVLAKADLVVCPTWGWEQIYGHARAYENGIYVASAMGIPFEGDIEGVRNPSEVIHPDGSVLVSGSRKDAGVVICELDCKDCDGYRSGRLADRHPDTYGNIAVSYIEQKK
ncbi:MAG: carbon-nitrogen hydrolase family protein [Lachnospiraceae bacterium]